MDRTIATVSPSCGLLRAKLTRGMRVKLIRTGKTIGGLGAIFLLRWDRSIAGRDYRQRHRRPPSPATLRIGALTRRGSSCYAACILRGNPAPGPRRHRRDEGRKLKEALQQMAEGVVQVFQPRGNRSRSSAWSATSSSAYQRGADGGGIRSSRSPFRQTRFAVALGHLGRRTGQGQQSSAGATPPAINT